jgi:hypothetical protein
MLEPDIYADSDANLYWGFNVHANPYRHMDRDRCCRNLYGDGSAIVYAFPHEHVRVYRFRYRDTDIYAYLHAHGSAVADLFRDVHLYIHPQRHPDTYACFWHRYNVADQCPDFVYIGNV